MTLQWTPRLPRFFQWNRALRGAWVADLSVIRYIGFQALWAIIQAVISTPFSGRRWCFSVVSRLMTCWGVMRRRPIMHCWSGPKSQDRYWMIEPSCLCLHPWLISSIWNRSAMNWGCRPSITLRPINMRPWWNVIPSRRSRTISLEPGGRRRGSDRTENWVARTER